MANITVKANVNNIVSFKDRDDVNSIYFIGIIEGSGLNSAAWESGEASQVHPFIGKTVYPLAASNYVFEGDDKHPVQVSVTSADAPYYIPVAVGTTNASPEGWLKVKRLTKNGSSSTPNDGE